MSANPASEKYVLVTGGTSGLGQAVALELARIGMDVTIVGRNPERGRETLAQLQRLSSGKGAFLRADLSSIRQTQDMAEEFLNNHPALHLLILSAGVMNFKKVMTDEGLETVFATNHLSRFLLANRLLEAIKAGAPSRIVLIGSAAIGAWAKIDFANLQAEKGFSGNRAMSQALLANDVLVAELTRQLKDTGVTINALHPGWVKTDIMRSAPPYMKFMMPIMNLISTDIKQGVQPPLYLATAPELDGVSGAYFDRAKRVDPPESTLDQALADQLWQADNTLINTVLNRENVSV